MIHCLNLPVVQADFLHTFTCEVVNVFFFFFFFFVVVVVVGFSNTSSALIRWLNC